MASINSERDENILNAWADGLSSSEIEKQFSITRGVLAAVLYRGRQRNDKRAAIRPVKAAPVNKFWTPELDEKLCELWNTTLTVRQMAKDLGARSESAVANRASVLGLGARAIAAKHVYAPYVEPEGSWEPLEGQEPIHLLDLGLRDCRWPVNVPERTFMSCGAPVDAGHVYCKHHRELSMPYRAPEVVKELGEVK